MKFQFKYSFLTVCMAVAMFACKDDNDVTPAVEEPKDSIVSEYVTLKANGVVEVNSLPMPKHENDYDYTLFSFAKMGIVGNGEDSIKTAGYDLAIAGPDGFDMTPNWGGTAPDYWDVLDKFSGSPSDVKVVILQDTTFDAVTAAPAASAFEHQLQFSCVSPVFNGETGFVEYFNFLPTIYVFLLNDGRYVKFQYVSLYKGAPKTATAAIHSSDYGYWTFKYYISEKGSTDLTTK